jgi:protein-disulfide isomerase
MDTTEKNGFLDKYLTPVAVVLGAIIIAVAFAFGQGGAKPATDGQQPAAVAVDIKDVNLKDSPRIGSPNAPVTMAIWYDYQCPYCKQLEQRVTLALVDKYVKDGKLQIVFKDFQFLGQDSDTAALFGRAVYEAYPDHFYDWYKAMFDAQDDEGDQGFGDRASVEALTRTVPGIDADRVIKLVDSKTDEYTKAIAADRAEGSAFGISGTPTAIIGTQLLTGNPLYDLASVSATIDAELKK